MPVYACVLSVRTLAVPVPVAAPCPLPDQRLPLLAVQIEQLRGGDGVEVPTSEPPGTPPTRPRQAAAPIGGGRRGEGSQAAPEREPPSRAPSVTPVSDLSIVPVQPESLLTVDSVSRTLPRRVQVSPTRFGMGPPPTRQLLREASPGEDSSGSHRSGIHDGDGSASSSPPAPPRRWVYDDWRVHMAPQLSAPFRSNGGRATAAAVQASGSPAPLPGVTPPLALGVEPPFPSAFVAALARRHPLPPPWWAPQAACGCRGRSWVPLLPWRRPPVTRGL